MRTPTPQRRSFLTALFAAPVVAAAPVLGAIPAPAVADSSELLALGQRLSPLLDSFRVALAKKVEAEAVYERLMPSVPDELRACRSDQTRGLTDRVTNLSGAVKGADGGYIEIYCSRNIRANMILWEINGRTTEGRRLHRLARRAKQYETAANAAYEQSGYEGRQEEARSIAEEVLAAVAKLTKIEPLSTAGVLLYARCLAVIPDVAKAAGYGGTVKQEKDLSRILATALLRVEGASIEVGRQS